MADPDQEHAEPGVETVAPSVPDGTELSQLFRVHNDVLVGYLTARLGSRQEAMEVAQEAYARLLQFHESSTPNLSRAYLFRTATNLAIDRLRRRRVEQRAAEHQRLFAELTHEWDDPATQLQAREQAQQLLQTLQ